MILTTWILNDKMRYFCILSDLVNRNFYLRDIVGMNTVDGVAHVLRGWDDDGEGQHAGGGKPGDYQC